MTPGPEQLERDRHGLVGTAQGLQCDPLQTNKRVLICSVQGHMLHMSIPTQYPTVTEACIDNTTEYTVQAA